jgi:ATP-binding cassette subfamily C protein CydD
VAFGEAAGILLIAQTALLVRVVDGALFHGAAALSLLPIVLAAFGVIGLRAAATWAARKASASYASTVKLSLREAVVRKLRTIGPLALAGMRAGEVASTAVDAVEAVEGYFARYLPQRAIATLLPFTILAAVFPLDWISGLVLVATAVFLPLSMIVIGEEAHERNRKLWAMLARMSGRFLDVLQGLPTVRMFGAAAREAAEIGKASDSYRSLTLSVLRIAFLSSLMMELISALSIAIVAVLCGLRLLSGSMGFFPGYFILLVAPDYFLTLRQLGTFYHSRMEAVSAAERIRDLLETPTAQPQGPGAATRAALPSRHAPSVELRGVSFSYGARTIIADATLQVGPGEHVALSGPSGTGKSTLLALLLGFARPSSGVILVDGIGLEDIDPAAWLRCVAWLPHRPTIFHGSLRKNLIVGRENATVDELDRALRLSRVDEFLPRLGKGLETPVGEGGQGLSVGQAQRVALARLFLREPGLVLLDEPTAHLDPENAQLVAQGIYSLCEGRTAIIATHDAAQSGLRTVVLEDGRLEEGR